MTNPKRLLTTITLTLALAAAGAAQETDSAATKTTTTTTTTTTAAPTTAATPATETAERPESRQAVRENFSRLLARHPNELTRVIVLDPSLLTNEPFLAKYPELGQFLAEHPEIRRNPHYYLQDHVEVRQQFRQRSAFEDFAEMLSIMFVSALIAGALVWLVRTIIEQKRWNQLSRRQTDVHTKILDRLGSSEELLAYIKTPAGTKYLESAPIPLHAAPPARRTPMTRVMWSIQIGVIVAAAGLGMLLVAARSTGDAEQGFFAMGAIAFCIGAGFVASALVAMFLSRRLGLSQDDGGLPPAPVADDPGLMR